MSFLVILTVLYLLVLPCVVIVDSDKYVSKAMKRLPTWPQNEKNPIYVKSDVDF